MDFLKYALFYVFIRRIFHKQRANRIEELYEHADMKSFRYNHRRGFVCMIDVCNYTQWCESNTDTMIYCTMTDLNRIFANILKKYNLLEKIELVGDCVMIVGWYNNETCIAVGKQMLDFALTILSEIPNIQKLFCSKLVSLRIGIHHGGMCGGFVSNPRKYQVFGRTINVASRIESAADNGTCLVSKSTIDLIKVTENMTIVERGGYLLKGISDEIECVQIY